MAAAAPNAPPSTSSPARAPQVEHPATRRTHRFWFENPVVGRPVNEDAPVGADTRLMPRDCREMVRPGAGWRWKVAVVAVAAAMVVGRAGDSRQTGLLQSDAMQRSSCVGEPPRKAHRPLTSPLSLQPDHDTTQQGVTYKAPLTVDLCFESDGAGGPRRITKRCAPDAALQQALSLDLKLACCSNRASPPRLNIASPHIITHLLPTHPPHQCQTRSIGSLPVMVKSKACHLRGLSRAELVRAKEEATEFGGYFVCNGIERIIRMLVQQVCASGCMHGRMHAARMHVHGRMGACAWRRAALFGCVLGLLRCCLPAVGTTQQPPATRPSLSPMLPMHAAPPLHHGAAPRRVPQARRQLHRGRDVAALRRARPVVGDGALPLPRRRHRELRADAAARRVLHPGGHPAQVLPRGEERGVGGLDCRGVRGVDWTAGLFEGRGRLVSRLGLRLPSITSPPISANEFKMQSNHTADSCRTARSTRSCSPAPPLGRRTPPS